MLSLSTTGSGFFFLASASDAKSTLTESGDEVGFEVGPEGVVGPVAVVVLFSILVFSKWEMGITSLSSVLSSTLLTNSTSPSAPATTTGEAAKSRGGSLAVVGLSSGGGGGCNGGGGGGADVEAGGREGKSNPVEAEPPLSEGVGTVLVLG